MTVNLRFSILGGLGHPEDAIEKLGIKYMVASPKPIGDQWWFWGCSNVPEELPEAIDILDLEPERDKALTKEQILEIRKSNLK